MTTAPSAFPAAARERISLCMIVKDEARCLARCLRSAAPWVGEIVIVDTGSTDETVAIAESFGARVEHFAWCDDFAAARNQSLELASREWALVLDADEELVVTDPDELARAVGQTVFDGVSFRVESRMEDGRTTSGMVFRLFRRTKPGMRYEGAIHEQVKAVRDGGVSTVALGCAMLLHDGYTEAVTREKDKTSRNVKLAEKLLVERPQDPFAWYSLGLACQPKDAVGMIEAYEKALTLLTEAQAKETYVLALHQGLAKGLMLRGRGARAAEVVAAGLAHFPTSPDLHFLRGHLRLDAKDFTGAAEDFAVCLTPEAARSPVMETAGATGYAAKAYLGLALAQTGRHDEAETLWRQAIAEAPATFVLPRSLLGGVLLQRGEWQEALPLLQAAHQVMPSDAEAGFKLGWCLFQLERFEEAEAVLSPLGDRPEVQHLRGRCWLERGDAKAALALLEPCPLPSAGLARGWAHYMNGEPQAASERWHDWMRAGAADWGTKDTLSTFLFLLHGGRRPSGEPERPAEPVRDMDRWFRLLLRHHRFDEVEAVIGRGPELGARMWRLLRRKFGATLLLEGFRDVGTMLILEAQQDEPDEPDVYYWLGMSSIEQNMVEEARAMWQKCLRLAPQHSLARQAMGLLG